MESLPETTLDETDPLRNVDSQMDESNPNLESRESKNLMKTLTFASNIAVTRSLSDTRDNADDESSTDNANDNSVEGREEDEEDKYEINENDKNIENKKDDDEEEEEEKERDIKEDEETEEEEEEREEEEEQEEEDEEEDEEEEEKEETMLIDYPFQIAKEIKVKSENDLSKIPSEVYYDRIAMLQMLRDFLIERPSLTLRNRYLEYKCFKHLQAIQVTGSLPIDDGSNLEDETEKDHYMKFLGYYKKESEIFRARENDIKLSLDNFREKLKEHWSNDAESFLELTSRETTLAIDLVFATTGRRLTQKRVEEMIRHQTSRRKHVAHERYTFIRQWYMFEEIDARIRKLETLGPGMKISDYEANFSAKLTAKTKIDERNKELQKARARVCGMMAAITHGNVKLAFLKDEIESKKNLCDQMVESVHKRREELSTMRSRLSITRNRYLKKRETAGLMLALPTLREMERVKDLRDLWKQEVDQLRSLNLKPRSTRKKKDIPDRKDRNADKKEGKKIPDQSRSVILDKLIEMIPGH